MFFAFLTTLLFSASSVLAHKSQVAVGPARANLGRLGVGVVLLGAWAYLFGRGHSGPAFTTFLLSGLAGMGVGDIAFFAALPLLGSRLTTTMNQCLSVPIAIVIEWLWLGTKLDGAQLGCIGLILAGIVVALLPTRSSPSRVEVRALGIALGVVAACGQGFGAVLTRKGFDLTAQAGETLDAASAAYQRLLGGIAITVIWFAARAWIERKQEPRTTPPLRAHGWIVIHALAGPVFGMASFQLALASAPAGLVLPITACAPLAVIPLAYWLEGERPAKRSIAGGIIAVIGAIALARAC